MTDGSVFYEFKQHKPHNAYSIIWKSFYWKMKEDALKVFNTLSISGKCTKATQLVFHYVIP